MILQDYLEQHRDDTFVIDGVSGTGGFWLRSGEVFPGQIDRVKVRDVTARWEIDVQGTDGTVCVTREALLDLREIRNRARYARRFEKEGDRGSSIEERLLLAKAVLRLLDEYGLTTEIEEE